MLKSIRLHPHNKPNSCVNCGNQFTGKICNQCGEKVFQSSQLSAGYYLHQAVDVFIHFENKVLHSMWLCFSKPGFLTQENLRGVRVPYAKPMQLFIVVNLLFYMIVTAYQRTDYTPSAYDNNGSNISDRPFLKWTSSIDSALINSINDLRNHKLENYDAKKNNGFKLFHSQGN